MVLSEIVYHVKSYRCVGFLDFSEVLNDDINYRTLQPCIHGRG